MTNTLELDSCIKLARSALSSVKVEMLAARNVKVPWSIGLQVFNGRHATSTPSIGHPSALPIFLSGHKAALQEMSSVRTCTRLISSKSSWGCGYRFAQVGSDSTIGVARCTYNESIISLSRSKRNLWSPSLLKIPKSCPVTKRPTAVASTIKKTQQPTVPSFQSHGSPSCLFTGTDGSTITDHICFAMP